MRDFEFTDSIFDTCIDTRKIYVPMNHRFTLHNHVDKSGLSLLYLHITQDGERGRIPLEGMKIEPKYWDQDKQRAKKTATHLPNFNLLIQNLEAKITKIKTTYLLNEQHLTLELFKDEFLNRLNRTDFPAFMHNYLETRKPKMTAGTYKNQMKTYKKVIRFKRQIPFSEITAGWLDNFKNFLLVDEKLATTSMNAHIKVIKKFLNLAHDRGIRFPLSTKKIVCGPTGGSRVDLDGSEIDLLAEYYTSRFIKDCHKKPLGLFLLSCFNGGFRISDAQGLTVDNLVDGRIVFTSQKTGKRQIVNINITSAAIIHHCPDILGEKYSDQYTNRMLKEIAEIVGIKKNVTFHVARHTFATNYLRLGGKVEVLQQILGHSDIKETMIYVHIVQEEQDRGIMILDNLIAGTHFSQLSSNLAG